MEFHLDRDTTVLPVITRQHTFLQEPIPSRSSRSVTSHNAGYQVTHDNPVASPLRTAVNIWPGRITPAAILLNREQNDWFITRWIILVV